MNAPHKIIFFGSADFSVPTLQALSKADWADVALVVTQPDKPVGRKGIVKPTPVKLMAHELNIPVTDVLADVLRQEATVGVLVAYGTILKSEILNHFTHGIVNVHPSLLPAWRGPAPIQAAMLAGAEETGVSIMVLDSGMDTGPLLVQESYRMLPSDTAESLHDQFSVSGANLLVRSLPDYLNGELLPQPQSEEGVSYSHIIKRTDGKISGADAPEIIMRTLRAYHPWPGVYGEWNGKRLKIVSAHEDTTGALILDEVQLEGKPVMPYADFLRGHGDFRLSDVQ